MQPVAIVGSLLCPQIGDGGDELNPNTKVPRMLGYRGLCDEGPVAGDDIVDKLDTDEEQFLENSKGRRLVASKKDEKDVDLLMERFFEDYADKDALEKVNRGCDPSGAEHARECVHGVPSDQSAKVETSLGSDAAAGAHESREGEASGSKPSAPLSLAEWQAQHGIPPADAVQDNVQSESIDVDVDMPTVDAHYCYGSDTDTES